MDNPPAKSTSYHLGALRISGIYLLLGILWILFSDKLAERLTTNPETLTQISIYKGWGYIVVTAVLLYWLIQRHTAALAESREKLRLVIDSVPALISYVDAEKRYQLNNKAYEEWFGRDVAGEKLEDSLGETNYREISGYIYKVLHGETVSYQRELRNQHGEFRFVDASYVPDRAADGSIRGFFALIQDITERKQAEQDLRLWADAFEHCAHGIAIGDPDTNRILVCNPAFAKLQKTRVEDIAGSTILSLYTATDREKVRHHITRADQIGHAQLEAEMIRKDSSTFPVQIDLVSVHGDDRDLLYRVVTVQDISERKKAQEQYAYQASILQQINDAVITSDQNLLIVGWNAAAEKMYGWQEGEVLGRPGEEIFKTEFFNTTRAEIVQRLQESGEFSVEVSQARKDGSRIYVEARTVAVRDDHNNVTFISVNRDITERKQTEKELKYQANIFTYLNDALVTTDENFIITSWNSAAEKIYGWAAQEVIGRKASEVLQTEFHNTTREIVTRRLLEMGEFSAEAVQARKDGTKVEMDVRTIGIRNEEGKLIRVVSVNRDITERKRNEDDIRRMNEKLEERVIERTAQLRAANKELESFSYSVSHDLRAPLRAINGYTQILAEDYGSILDEEGKRICGIITGEAKRMGDLIDDLLSFSRLSRKDIQPTKVDMKALVTSVYGELTRESDRERIDFKVGKLPAAQGDPALLHQVWTNLIANAIKFTSKKDRATIEVGMKRSDKENVYCVRDNGAGFDIQYIDKLFGVFQRLHSEDDFEGTGVGLAIVQRIIQRHRGRVWAEGEVDKGATFYFALPKGNEDHE